MKRSTIDKIVSSLGVAVALILVMATAGLIYAHDFIHTQVYDQLSAEKIYFPKTTDAAYKALPSADQTALAPYAGQQLVNGAQAGVFANNYIAVHLQNIGGGKTYSELSEESLANPSDTALAGKVNTVFKGEMLRGVLLNAYAFDTMAVVAWWAAVVALTGAVVFAVLAALGFSHAQLANRPTRSTSRKRR